MKYTICTKAGNRPFKNTKEVLQTIKRERRYKGLTVLIEDEWYWFKDKDTLEKVFMGGIPIGQESGEWTPKLEHDIEESPEVEFIVHAATYSKIGRLVILTITFELNKVGFMDQDISISGVPFVPKNRSNFINLEYTNSSLFAEDNSLFFSGGGSILNTNFRGPQTYTFTYETDEGSIEASDNIQYVVQKSGTWEPEIIDKPEDIDYIVESATWFKMGEIVTVYCKLEIIGEGEDFTDTFKGISGIPFVPFNTEIANGAAINTNNHASNIQYYLQETEAIAIGSLMWYQVDKYIILSSTYRIK